MPLAVRDNLTRTFNAGKARLRLELVKNLAEIDVLKRAKLENELAVFNERLHLFQHDFLGVVAQSTGTAPDSTNRHDMRATAAFEQHVPTAFGAAAGVVGGSAVAGFAFTTATTGWWIFSSTVPVTVASSIAGVTGASLDVVSGGLTLGGGVAGAIAANKAMAGYLRQRIRKRLMADFDNRIVPALDDWSRQAMR